MKKILLSAVAVCALALASCVTDPLTGKQSIDQATVNTLAGLAIDLAARHFGVPADSITAAKQASAQLAGIAAQAQANLGKTPKAANIAQGSAIPVVGKEIQAQLPAAPIDQQTVNALFAAAEKADKK